MGFRVPAPWSGCIEEVGRPDGERAGCKACGYRLSPVLVQQCMCSSTMWNGSLISALCLCWCGGCREECYEVCENMTWVESGRLLWSIFPFLLFHFLLFSPLLSCLPPFSDLVSFCVSFGNQLGYLGEKLAFRAWWHRNQDQSWWAEARRGCETGWWLLGSQPSQRPGHPGGQRLPWGCSTVCSWADLIAIQWALRHASSACRPCVG